MAFAPSSAGILFAVKQDAAHRLIKAACFAMLELVHPFQDGNWRMAECRKRFYRRNGKLRLGRSAGRLRYAYTSYDEMDSAEFIAFMLSAINAKIDGFTDQVTD
jgi:hypothetical protein